MYLVEIMKMGREFAATFDGIFRLWIFPYSAVVIYNPEDVEVCVLLSLRQEHNNKL